MRHVKTPVGFNRLCKPCREEWLRWSDYTGTPGGIRLITVGSPLSRGERVDAIYDLVASQHTLIVNGCDASHASGVDTEEEGV